MPVLQVYIGAAAAQCIHLFLPLHELLYAELQEVQGPAVVVSVDGDASVEHKGRQQQQQFQLQSTEPESSAGSGSGFSPEAEGSLDTE